MTNVRKLPDTATWATPFAEMQPPPLTARATDPEALSAADFEDEPIDAEEVAPLAYDRPPPPRPKKDRASWLKIAGSFAIAALSIWLALKADGGMRVFLWAGGVLNLSLGLLGVFIALTSGGGPNTVARGLLARSKKLADLDQREVPFDLASSSDAFDLVWLAGRTAELESAGFTSLGDFHAPAVRKIYKNARGFNRVFLGDGGRTVARLLQSRMIGWRSRKVPTVRVLNFNSTADNGDEVVTTTAGSAQQLASPPFVLRESREASITTVDLLRHHTARLQRAETGGRHFKRVLT